MNTEVPNLKISDELKLKIMRELVEPSYLDDISSIMKTKKRCKSSGQLFETLSKIFVAFGSITSFSAGFFNQPLLSFVAGTISTVSLAMLQFSSFSYYEHKKQSRALNILLEKLNLETIPLLEREGVPSQSCRREVTAADPDAPTEYD